MTLHLSLYHLSRMSPSEILSSVSGLSTLGAEPTSAWMKAFLEETAKRMKEGAFSMSQLGRLAQAISGEAPSGDFVWGTQR